MTSFEKLRNICEKNSRISKSVIDEYLLHYAAATYNLDRAMAIAFSNYQHVIQEFEPEWVNYLKAQFIAHKIFKSRGLIRKILTHTEIRKLVKELIR